MTATFIWESDVVVRGRVRIPLAVIAAVAVAEIAVLLLRPAHGVIKPADVRAKDYFSHAQIQKAQDFRRPQLWLYGGTLLIEGGLLLFLVLRPPARLQGDFKRPVLVAAVAGAGLSVALAIATLPIGVISQHRARDVGLVTQDWGGYAADLAKSWVIGGVLAGAGAAIVIALMRRLPRTWWLPGAAIVFAFGVGTVYAGPVIIDPLFNKFTPARPAVRSDVLDLARKSHVSVGEVLEVDASKRTTAANAYVTGLGHTKRVVLYDNLVDHFSRRERQAVVAHELGHVEHHDIRTGLLYLLIVAPMGMWAIALITRELDPREDGNAGPQTIPALAAAIALVVTPIGIASNQLSRGFEAHADSAALRTTNDPDAVIAFEKGITLRNVANPDPPGWASFLLGTHPTTMQRIGAAEAYRDGKR
jgi:STE24 endopeptidase